jgi:competence protein ComEC
LTLFGIAGALHGRAAIEPPPSVTADGARLWRGRVEEPTWATEGVSFLLRTPDGTVLVRAPLHEPPLPRTPCVVYGTAESTPAALNPRLGAGPAHAALVRAKAGSAVFLGAAPESPQGIVTRARAVIRSRITALYDDGLRGLLSALLLGDYSAVQPESAEGFRRLGLTHVLAISGVHMTILAGIVAIVARALVPRGRIWAAVAVAAVLAYTPIAGGSGPVLRASLMSAWGLLLLARGRAFDPLHVLSTTFLVTSAIAPRAAMAPGVILSYSATYGILAFTRWVHLPPRLARVRAIWQAMGVSIFATLATVPSIISFFGIVPLGSIVYSIPAEILSTMALVPAFGGLCLLPLRALSDLGFSAAWPALVALDWLTTRPLPAPAVTLAPEWALALTLAALSAIPPRRRGLTRWARWVPLAAGLALVVHARRTTDAPVVTILDVGAADAAFVQVPGATFLIDTGRAYHEGVITRAQSHLGIARPALVLTHPDDDHDGGARALLARGRVRSLLYAVTERGRAHDWLGAAGKTPERALSRGDTLWRHARGSILCLHPAPGDSLLEDNERSLVLELRWDGDRLVLMGDLEGEGLERFLARESISDRHTNPTRRRMLKLGHHGSPPSTPEALLDLEQPALALVSTGRSLEGDLDDRLSRRGITVLSTNGSGAIRLRWQEETLRIDRWRGRWRTETT